MLNSKLLNIWRCFPTKKLKRLGDFLGSPFFNKNEDLIRIFDYLKKFFPTFDNAKALSKEVVFKKALNKKYDPKLMGYYMSYLVKLSEKFIVIDQINEQEVPSEYHYQLLKFYHTHKIEKNYRNSLKEAHNVLKKTNIRDAQNYHNKYLIEELNHLSFAQKHKHVYNNSLQNAMNHLEVYFISKKLQYSCEMVNTHNVMAGEYQLNLLEEMLKYISNNPLADIPCIAIYHRILLMLRNSEEEKYFIQLKQLLKEHAQQFSKMESRNMYIYAVNHTVRKINKGFTNYQKELFDLYVELLDKEIIFDDGKLSPWTYKNIATIALRVGENDWMLNFIEKYKDRIEAPFQKNAYNYNLALYKFTHKDYHEAMQLLQKVEFSDVYYGLEAKAFLTKIYYELKEEDLLNSHIHAFKIYLRRNKFISSYMKEIYLNLIEFIRLLQKTPTNQKDNLIVLKEKVQQTKKVADLNWLIKKIDIKIAN